MSEKADDTIFNFVYRRSKRSLTKKERDEIYYNEGVLEYFDQVSEICLNTDRVKYLNWSYDAKFISIGAEFGYYDIIDVFKRKSIYEYPLFNNLHYVHDIKFLMNTGNSKAVFSDDESIRLFDINYPHRHATVVHDMKIGYSRMVLNIHDPNVFVFQFGGNHFTHFDVREKYYMNCLYYPIITNITEPVYHCDICPTRPNELAICYMHQMITLFDFRMLNAGKANFIPCRGLIGSLNPFHDYNKPIVTAIEYSTDGTEMIATEFSGYSKIISCDPAFPAHFKLTPGYWSQFYSRTSYSEVYNHSG